MSWFYEHRKLDQWWPVTEADEPSVKTVRGRSFLKTAQGLGAEVRNVTRVPEHHAGLSLDILAELHGGQGRA